MTQTSERSTEAVMNLLGSKTPYRSVLRMARNMVPSMIVGGVVPLAAYLLAGRFFPPPSIVPVSLALVGPAGASLVSMASKRSADPFVALMATMMGFGLVVTVATVLITGNEKLILVSRSATTLAMGAACLGSLILPKTISFYFARQISVGRDPDRQREFNNFWQLAEVRFVSRATSLVWGVALVGEFGIRVLLVYSLPAAAVIASSTVIFMTISLGTMLWTVVYGSRKLRRIRQQVASPQPAAQGSAVQTG